MPEAGRESAHRPRIGTLLNLASCHDKQGKTASAWSEFTDAAARALRSGQQERADFAAAQARALEGRLSRVVIVAGAGNSPELKLDGTPLGTASLGSPIPVDPGEHTLEASAVGKRSYRRVFQVAPGPATQTITIPPLEAAPAVVEPKPAPLAKTAPPSGDAASREGGGIPASAWIAGGLGLAGIGVGTVFGLMAMSKESDADTSCPSTTCQSAGDLALHDDAQTYATVSTIGFGVGIAGIGLAVVLWAVSGDSSEGRSATVTPTPQGFRARF